MKRYLGLIAYGSSEWDDATKEVRQSFYRDHAIAAAELLPASHSIEIRPTITVE